MPWLGSNTTNLYKTTVSIADLRGAASSMLYICALGYGSLTVDGKPLAKSGVLTISGWTNNERLNMYESYDLSSHVVAAESNGQAGMTIELSLGHGWRDQSKFPRKVRSLSSLIATASRCVVMFTFVQDSGESKGDAIDRVFRAMLKVTTLHGETFDALTRGSTVSWTTATGPITMDSVWQTLAR